MTRSNPLFVDSTKFHGDRIGAQIELNQVAAYEGEEVIIQITDHQGEVHRLVMQQMNEAYVARVWLHHQRSITYQFFIEKDGIVLFASDPKQSRAQYAIIDTWEPNLRWDEKPEEVVEESAEGFQLPDTPWTADYGTTVESLIEKWGL